MMSRKLNKILEVSLWKSIYYTFFSHKVERHGKGILLLYKGVILDLQAKAKIYADKCLKIGSTRGFYAGRTSVLVMQQNSRLKVRGNFSFWYGADIVLLDNAVLELGNSFINSDCRIRCYKYIKIGDGCAISHDFNVMDGNGHFFNGEKKMADVIIGDRVWIGTRVTILPGTTIGDGSVIAAGSVVKGNFPSKSLIAGVPAKVIKVNIDWGK